MKWYAFLVATILLFSCKTKTEEKEEVAMSEPEAVMVQESEWEILFDGTSFDGWHFYNGGEVGEPWKIEDGAMVLYPPKQRPEGANYNLVSDKNYTNFVLSLEWKISQNGNSGIFWGVVEDEKFGEPYQTGPEIQVLDDEGHPDGKNGTTHQSGALYDMVPPSEKAVKPVGEWNLCVLTINHSANEGRVELNGTEVCKFPVNGEAWDAMVENSKFKGWEGFGAYQTGKIGLQDHGNSVDFRNIKIKELK